MFATVRRWPLGSLLNVLLKKNGGATTIWLRTWRTTTVLFESGGGGIVPAYRRQKIDSKLSPDEDRYLKEIRRQVETLRKDARPWVKQASLHALYHIEKRKAELKEEARKEADGDAATSK